MRKSDSCPPHRIEKFTDGFLSGEENQRREGKRGRKSKEVRLRKNNGGGKKMVPGKGEKIKIRKRCFLHKNWRSHLNFFETDLVT